MGKVVLIIVAFVIPILACIYAIYKKQFFTFLIGVLAFTISQFILRLPLLEWLAENSTAYHFFRITKPFLYVGCLALSAGIFEELARWVAMKYVLKKRTIKTGLFFGLGHGGIEAFILVGISALSVSAIAASPLDFYHSSLERLCAMIVHVSLSFIVLYGVKNNRFIYCLLSIVLHGLLNFAVVATAAIASQWMTIIVLAITTIAIVIITYFIYRRNNDEKIIVSN